MRKTGGLFKKIRIGILLSVLVIVGMNAWSTHVRTTNWDFPLWAVIYPINAEQNDLVSDYINKLDSDTFIQIEQFFSQEADKYNLTLEEPIVIKIAPEIYSSPPLLPKNGNIFSTMWWSLKLRYWAFSSDTYEGASPDIKVFVNYFHPAEGLRLEHSLGLKKGLIGVVNAYSSQKFQHKTNVVIAHEILHTVGATDKYDPLTNQPIFPEGYANPELSPSLPQTIGEIMAARIPKTKTKSKMPSSLNYTIIGEKTAREIKWIKQ